MTASSSKGRQLQPQKAARLKKAEQATRNLIERIHAPAGHARMDAEEPGLVAFFIGGLGGLRLTGRDSDLYRACIDTLMEIHGTGVDRSLSREAATKILQRTILRSLRPGRENETRARFSARLSRELRHMRRSLLEAPGEWRIIIQVHGLGPRGLPFSFGGVDFEAGTTAVGERIGARIVDFSPRRPAAKTIVERERRAREESRKELEAGFVGHAVASFTVRAHDNDAAKQRGVEHVRRVVDVLNYFDGFLDERRGKDRRAYLAPDGRRTSLNWACYRVDGEAVHASVGFPPSNRHVAGVDLTAERPAKIGMMRANELLAKTSRSDLEERIVNALAWAGRAAVAHRRDQAFLFYAIALESVLTKPSTRVGVTDRLRLRAAHLIGRGSEARQQILHLMSELYEIRSTIVHSGDSGTLTDADLQAIAELVDLALTTILRDEKFTKMRDARDFDCWFDAQLLG